MNKLTKSLLALATAFGLLGANAIAVQASEPASLTYEQFLASEGYKEFEALGKASAAYLANQNGVELVTSVSMRQAGTESVLGTSTIQATKTRVQMVNEMLGVSSKVLIIDGAAYTNLSEYKDSYGPDNINKVTKRIPGISAKMVKLTAMPEDLSEYTPENIFDSSDANQTSLLLSQFKDLLALYTFSEIVKTTNAQDETLTDYSWDMSFSLFGMKALIRQTYTFDSNSMLVLGKLLVGNSTDANADPFATDGSSTTTITTTVKNDLVIDAPATSLILDESSITRMSNQIIAEEKSTKKAAAIAAKALKLAKATKAKLSSKHLADAAKSLKYSVTKISNGIKISATVSGVKGNLCLTVVKGKTSTKTC